MSLGVEGFARRRVLERRIRAVGGRKTLLGKLGVQFDLAPVDRPVAEQLGPLQQLTDNGTHRVFGEF